MAEVTAKYIAEKAQQIAKAEAQNISVLALAFQQEFKCSLKDIELVRQIKDNAVHFYFKKRDSK